MRFTSLPLLEETFLRTAGNGQYTLQPIAVPVPGEALTVQGFLCVPQHRAGYYHDVAHPKERIVIHYTAGSLRSDLETLTTSNRHVSVPFVIARDGTIYQLYSSRFWSGNLGKGLGNINTGNAQDKCTIAIEISNYGFLVERAGNLETIYSREGARDVYCALTETEAYQQLSTPFRSQSFFATFSNTQYQSLIILLRYLTATYNIPRVFLPQPQRFQTTDDVLNFRGIVTHVNYRTDGKWDIGPAFDWDQVIAGVQAPVFTPVIAREAVALPRGISATPITSENEIDVLLPPAEDAAKENEPYEERPRTADPEPDMDILKTSAPAGKKKLYALLVGIDDYNANIVLNRAVVFPQLSGCVPDAKRMKAYIENEPSFDTDVKLLTNKEATKSNIARQFHEHLGQAKEGDTALFFFSGHGTQEWADLNVWKEDTDGRLECIVCYYEKADDKKLLADKELRFLLHNLSQTGAHCVALFDCCHSGDNTRAAVATTFSDVKVKAIEYNFPERDWSEFLFSDVINKADVKQKGAAAVLPEGAHFQISACESNEPALEVSGSGVFTQTLLNVLNAAGGAVSYRSLEARIRQYLKNVYEQKPRLYVSGDAAGANTNFLNKPYSGESRSLGEVVYNERDGWKLTLGAIHGITETTKTVSITDPETGEKFEGAIGDIEMDASVITTTAPLKKAQTYNGAVNGLFARPIQVCFQRTDDDLLKEMRNLLDAVMAQAGPYVIVQENEQAAEHVVRTLKDQFYITRPGDPLRPLAAPQPAAAPTAILDQLIQISKWTFLKELQNNTETAIPENVLKTTLTVNDLATLNDTGVGVIHYNNHNGVWENNMAATLTNTSNANLYCSALYLTSAFGSDPQLLHPILYMLEPGNSVNLTYNNDPKLLLGLSDVAKYYNWTEEVEYLKIMVSTDPFDVRPLLLDDLPKPPVPDAGRSGQTRGINLGSVNRKLKGWRTQTLTLRLQNPVAGNLAEADKKAMRADAKTAAFAAGLYPEGQVGKKNGNKEASPTEPQYREATIITGDYGERVRGITINTDNVEYQTAPAPAFEATDAAEPPSTDGGYGGSAAPAMAPPVPKKIAAAKKAAPKKASVKKAAAKKSSSKDVKPSREGQLEYDIPGQMQTGNTYACKVVIAGLEVAAAAMKLSPGSVHAGIRVADEMSVQLIDCSGGSDFTIVARNTERQSIDTGEMTKWAFDVTPKQSGVHCLVLKITMHQNGKNKDLDILEKEVLVSAAASGAATPAPTNITRILFIAANPTDARPIRTGAESEKIKEEIQLARNRDRYVFTTNNAVTTRTLPRAILQEDPTIVHFSGHGTEDGLCLETEDGEIQLVKTAALDALFKNFSASIACVILNACYSEAQAKAIVKHIQFVIGMNQVVKDSLALDFSVHFYQALVSGRDIEQSFNLGLAGIALDEAGAETVAVLLKKGT